ncbi:sensory rhodopsin transducer, partial [Stenotrophomonas maltophilia]|uniref:sensory rhodopsin transducer n=1 Tax=Stenotrophomonas maltophilia TaxID=40324 RepID=UPI0039C4847A
TRHTVPAPRPCPLPFTARQDPAPVPRGTGFATLVESDQPIIVQHTRLDSRQPANSIMTTIAHPL